MFNNYPYQQMQVPNTQFSQPNYGWQPQPTFNQQSRPAIPGRMINDISEITPNEVVMDGRVSIFPKNDFSCIYAKAWNGDGTIQTVMFVPAKVEEPTPKESIDIQKLFADVNERLDKIEEMITRNRGGKNNESK